MLMCRKEDCTCWEHRFLDFLNNGLNDEAKSALLNVQNFYQLIDQSGQTLLHYSVQFCNENLTEHLIEQGCDVNAQDFSGVTPLMLAVRKQNSAIVQILLNSMVDILVTDSDGGNSLLFAFQSCSKLDDIANEEVQLILKLLFDEVNREFLEGRLTEFMIHAHNKVKLALLVCANAEISKFLLENDVYPIDFRDTTYGRTALHWAIFLGRFDKAKMLIESGANIDDKDNTERAILHYYIPCFEDADENCEVLKILLESSQCLSEKVGLSSYTLIEHFLGNGKEKTVRTILMSNVNLDLCINDTRSLLSLLISNSRISDLNLLIELNIPFDVNDGGEDSPTPLSTAISYKFFKKVQFLLERGANVYRFDFSEKVPLAWISSADPDADAAIQIFELLVDYGREPRSFIAGMRGPMNFYYKIILANLAMKINVDSNVRSTLNLEAIFSKPTLKAHFQLCEDQIEQMKDFKVLGTITMFKLLTATENQLAAYARNSELFPALNRSIENFTKLELYYVHLLKRNLSRGQELAKLELRAAQGIEALMGSRVDFCRSIVYEIISYLGQQDLRTLARF